ncbi:PREDICTED: putative F-box/kelch-repeat protein At3g20710 [Camelina sativa]|uniref:F-box/kelch-repeat protein At3g20710 n=1 Tax=Camelina sativa TaxID=90675 RepID=A0ABM0WAY8_CAMSA|nr:PREDICTED: putative F-box/kelch-repeat protein At3g20710 [Camelina sativa]
MMMSNLPKDLMEEILSRVPFINLRAVRSTCKMWNDISKTRFFVNKNIHKAAVSGEREFLMVTEFDVHLVSANLHYTSQNNDLDLFIKRKAKLNSRGKAAEAFHNSQVIQCNGVFLCVRGHILVVWNPYWGHKKWILPRAPYERLDEYALGYDKSSGSHKILRLFGINVTCLEIYDLSSKSWKVHPDGTLEWDRKDMKDCVSLKGDTYWYGRDKESEKYCLLCFDFTREMFGPCLPLPFDEGHATLSAVKEEKLAVLLQLWDTMDIWVTNNIEPAAVSWSIFLKLDMKPIIHYHNNCYGYGDFFIDEEKKVAVVFEKERSPWVGTIYKRAHITGENGYIKSVDLRESPNTLEFRRLCSYVPSSMKIM